MKRDPAGDVDGPNLYAYVRNSPLGAVDPTGLVSFVVPLKVVWSRSTLPRAHKASFRLWSTIVSEINEAERIFTKALSRSPYVTDVKFQLSSRFRLDSQLGIEEAGNTQTYQDILLAYSRTAPDHRNDLNVIATPISSAELVSAIPNNKRRTLHGVTQSKANFFSQGISGIVLANSFPSHRRIIAHELAHYFINSGNFINDHSSMPGSLMNNENIGEWLSCTDAMKIAENLRKFTRSGDWK